MSHRKHQQKKHKYNPLDLGVNPHQTEEEAPVPERRKDAPVPATPVPQAATPKIRQLIDRLGEGDYFLAEAARKELTALGLPAVAALSYSLKNDDSIKKLNASMALARMGEAGEDVLIASLAERNGLIRCYAAQALGVAKSRRAVIPLVTATRDKEELVRAAAAKALASVGGPDAEQVLQTLLTESSSKRVQQSAAIGLAELGDGSGLATIIKAMQDEDEFVRAEAIASVETVKDSRLAWPLLQALRDPVGHVRASACRTLAKLKFVQAVVPLFKLLEDDELQVCVSAALALGSLGDPLAVKPLVGGMLGASDISKYCVRALREIGETAVPPLVELLSHKEYPVRRAAAQALVAVGGPAVDDLMIALGSTDPIVRSRAATALGQIGELRAVDPLRRAMLDRDKDVIQAAKMALAELGLFEPELALLSPVTSAKYDNDPMIRGESDVPPDETVALNSKVAARHCHEGVKHMNESNFIAAIREFQRSLEIVPSSVEAHTGLGIALQMSGNRQEALSHLRAAVRIQPAHAGAQLALGYYLAEEGLLEEAIVATQTAVTNNPFAYEAHRNLANFLADAGRLEESIAEYQVAAWLFPKQPGAYVNLGWAYARTGDHETAVALYETAILNDPTYGMAYLNLGLSLQNLNRNPEARKALSVAVKLNPGVGNAHYALANSLFADHELAEAMREYREAIRLNPQDAEARFNLGLAMMDSGQADEGWMAILQAIALSPELKARLRH